MSREESSANPQRPRVYRVWKGVTSAADAEEYVSYMSRTGLPGLRRTPGNLGVFSLLRTTGNRAEHLVVSLWASEEAILRFAGNDISRAVFYPEDDHYLIEKDLHADHYSVVFADGGTSD